MTTLPVGTTVAGSCNGTAGSANNTLNVPRGIALTSNGTTLIVAEEGNKRVQAFDLSAKKPVGSLLMKTPLVGQYPSFVMSYNGSLFVSVPAGQLVTVWPSISTLPPSPPYTAACSSQYFNTPMGISMDSDGSIYIVSQTCHWVTRWTGSNASQVVGIAGSSGASSQSLSYPAGIDIDEQHKSLYVADFSNHRVQKFDLHGNGSGITVAGGNGPGSLPSQLYLPIDVTVSKLNGAIYVADYGNNRVQRWDVNATQGVTVAGNPGGSSGTTPVDLNGPFSVALDPIDETFLYVSEYSNHRVLRFTLS